MTMLRSLSGAWWLFLLRGILAILLAVMFWARPDASLATLVLFFGAWMLVDGVFTSIAAISSRKQNTEWGWMLASGVLSLVLGLLTLRAPGLTLVVLMLYVAAWAFMLGIAQIALGWRIRKEVQGEWTLYLGGAVAVLFGVAILWNPAVGAVGVLWAAAMFSLLYGIAMVALGLRLRKLAR